MAATEKSHAYPYPKNLFDLEKRREGVGAILYGESGYEFLDRMAKDSSDERRARANQLFSAYPEGDAK